MLKLSVIICLVAQFLIKYPSVLCIESDDTLYFNRDESTGINLDSTNHEYDSEQIENFIDPHSLYYDRLSKRVIEDVEPLPINHGKRPKQESSILKESSKECDTLKLYYKRLILMLLSNANLKVEDDLIEGQLFIKGTSSQIRALRRIETGNYSLKEIDSILSEIILQSSYYNYFFHVPNSSEVVQSLSNFLDYYVEVVIIASSVLAIVMLSRIMSVYRALFIILITLVTVSFYMTWWHLVKEAEIKLAAAQVKYIEMPAACQPHNMNMWDRIKSIFFDDKECVKYLEARMANPKLQVTPALVLSHLFATVTMHPVAHIGEAISKFVNNATAHLYWLQAPVQILLYLCLPAFLMILVFSLRGGSFNLGLGPLFRFSFSTHRQTSLPDAHKRQTIELIREVLAEVPGNILPSIIQNNESVPLSITNDKQEDKKSTDNSCENESTKLISTELQKELNRASGDSVENNLLSEKSKEESERYVDSVKNNAEKHIGSGDA
ncbi:hypothetical protein KPH14_006857 [Odynerus spinipes]|uniref:Chloride channel CLIC-like protein 1 n=1 Tax=Odynerus spinipes TaxID=1348599 RepID=A0AAD9RR98_9HYME|nr:hypothetical protein KPH14_006857 [Odynerus spinipes]